MKNPQEKRSFFRINSELVIDFHSVDAYAMQHTEAEAQFPDNARSLNLAQELKRLDREAATHLTAISELSRPLGDYLALMSKKVDLVAQQHFADQSNNQHLIPTQANLSEGGLAFSTQKPLYKGSHLALQLKFLSDFSSIACYASVIRCDSAETSKSERHSETYHIACKFHDLNDTKQEIIGKHIMRAQLAAKRVH